MLPRVGSLRPMPMLNSRALTLVMLSLAVLSHAANWPQWRGPDGSGVSAETKLPEEWSAAKNIKWKTPIPGRGHSQPIIWGNRIFLTTSIEGAPVPGGKAPVHIMEGKEFKHPDSAGADRSYALKVLALDRDSGKILWERTAFEGKPYDDRHKKNTYASPTPATDGRYVFAYFGSEGLYAYDFDGKLVWTKTLGQFPTLGMGAGTSPVLYENLVIIQRDSTGENDSYIAAFDKKTGKEMWHAQRKVQVSWSTPLLVRNGDRTELITSANESIIAYDPATGKELWRSQGLESNAIPSPVAGHGMVYLSAGYPAKRVYAIRTGAGGDLERVAWKYEKGTAYVPSPILYGDYLYLMTDRGLVTAIDAKTGEVKYEGGRPPVPATFSASPIAFEGKILITSEEGDTFVIQAGPKHEVIRTNSLGEPVFATPAVADGRIYIRGEKHLYCISAQSEG